MLYATIYATALGRLNKTAARVRRVSCQFSHFLISHFDRKSEDIIRKAPRYAAKRYSVQNGIATQVGADCLLEIAE
jgi:hypothetical protein